MIPWFKPRPAPPRDALLKAIPVKNALVREKPHGKGLRLTGPVQSGWRRSLGVAGEKTFELDELGTYVWQGIDGRRTVEGAIRRFSEGKRMNLREAEVAVLAFLKLLVQRGLVALASEQPG